MRLAASHHSPDWNYAACATANKAKTSTAEKRSKCWKNKEWERNLKTAGKLTLNSLNYAQWTDKTKTHTAMYWNISDQLNEGQFLFYSIIFLYKNQIFIYTASILDTYYINFSHSNKIKRKAIKHQSTPGLSNSSCHSTWSIQEIQILMRSTFTEGRKTRQLSELELGRWIKTNRNTVFLKQFSCPTKQRTHSQAELVNRFLFWLEVKEVRLHGTSGILRNILLKYLQNRLQI